jgi:murein DD-endopeptidase MepM/ murein hydrolase activator NlpD
MLGITRKQILLALLSLAVLATIIWFVRRRRIADQPVHYSTTTSRNAVPSQQTASPSTAPSPPLTTPPSPPAESDLDSQPTPNAPPPSFVGQLKLIVPVAGVDRNQLVDTFSDSRAEGRTHDAIDIPASPGTPVIAAVGGEIIKLFQSEPGGTTIYQLGEDRRLVFYYAHLQGYAQGLKEGKVVKQGEIIGYVGDTGNAGRGNYHLHFSIAVVSDPKRYWEGENINPYPLLRNERVK